MIIRALLAGALLCASLVVPARAQTGVIPSGVTSVLADLSRAWAGHDRSLIERVTDAAARTSQLKAFDNAAELRFGMYEWRATTHFSGNLASDRVKQLHPGREVASFHVVERYTMAGIEQEPYLEDDYFSFTRTSAAPGDPYDGWRLTSTTDFDVLGAFSTTHLWDGGPVKTASSPHFLLLAHPAQLADVKPALEVAEQAYDDVSKFWPRKGAGKYVLVAPASGAELGKMFQSTVDLSKFVAFAVGSVDRESDAGWKHGGVRIFLQLSRFSGRDAENQRNVFSHELIHAVTRPETGPWVPVWVEEGLATWGASGRSELRGVNAGRPSAFPQDWQFSVGSSRDIVNRYVQSQLAVQLLGEKYETAGVARFYDALGSRRVVAGTQDYQLREALRTSGLWSLEDWTRTWRSRL